MTGTNSFIANCSRNCQAIWNESPDAPSMNNI